jgi:hypothetical protein
MSNTAAAAAAAAEGNKFHSHRYTYWRYQVVYVE